MISPTQIRKPENWQDFEKLCKKLWGEVWECSASIKRNGRNGQNQSGVDISGIPKNESNYYGIQCKGKSDYSKTKLTQKEIDEEIAKALNFSPPLKSFIIATTADKDVNIEQYIREKNLENIGNGFFTIDVFSWGDIVDLLEEYKSTYNWYINNCQYKDSSDVGVFINQKTEFNIIPHFIRTTTEYVKMSENRINEKKISLLSQKIALQGLSTFPRIPDPWNTKRKVDYSWCTIPITIQNIGSTVIEDYKLYLLFDKEKTEEIDDKYRAFNPGSLINQSIVASVNIDRRNNREVFESSEYSNVIEFRPLNSVLVQDEHKTFKISVKPKAVSEEILIQWVLKSRDYKKNGELKLIVNKEIEEKIQIIEVEKDCEIKDTEIILEPKIIEE
jgi:hypothetical protein